MFILSRFIFNNNGIWFGGRPSLMLLFAIKSIVHSLAYVIIDIVSQYYNYLSLFQSQVKKLRRITTIVKTKTCLVIYLIVLCFTYSPF